MAAELMGSEQVYLWANQLLIKPPAAGDVANVGWHQDRYYWQILRGEHILTAWLPLADLDETMGPLRFVVGSHRNGFAGEFEGFTPDPDHAGPSVAESRHDDSWVEHTVLLAAGGVSFHSPFTLHGSGPNVSDRDRPGMALHLIGDDVTIRRGRLHSLQAVTTAPDGAPWRGPRTPRIWPPDPEPADPVPASTTRRASAGSRRAGSRPVSSAPRRSPTPDRSGPGTRAATTGATSRPRSTTRSTR